MGRSPWLTDTTTTEGRSPWLEEEDGLQSGRSPWLEEEAESVRLQAGVDPSFAGVSPIDNTAPGALTQTEMPANNMGQGFQPGRYPWETPKPFGVLPQGITQRVSEGVFGTTPDPNDLSQDPRMFENETLETARRVGGRFVTGMQRFLPEMIFGTMEDPAAMPGHMAEYAGKTSEDVGGALPGSSHLGVPQGPSLPGQELPRVVSVPYTDEERGQFRANLRAAPEAPALLATMVKGLGGKLAKGRPGLPEAAPKSTPPTFRPGRGTSTAESVRLKAEPKSEGFKQKMADYQDRKMAVVEAIGEHGSEFDTKSGKLAVSKNIDPGNKSKYPWRITRINKEGTPAGHDVFKNIDEVSHEVVSSGGRAAPKAKELRPDDNVVWSSPHSGKDVTMNFRGFDGDQAVLYNPKSGMQVSVPKSQIKPQPPPPRAVKPKAPAKQKEVGKQGKMTTAEFDNYWVEQTRAGIKKEVGERVPGYQSEIKRLKRDLARDPDNPGNQRIRDEVKRLKSSITEERSRLSRRIRKPSEFMSEEQIAYHSEKVQGEQAPKPQATKAPPAVSAKGKPGKTAPYFRALIQSHITPNKGLKRGLDFYGDITAKMSTPALQDVAKWVNKHENPYIRRRLGSNIEAELRSRGPKSTAKPPAVETPKQAVSEIIEGKRESKIGVKEFKTRMLAELDKAIDKSEGGSQRFNDYREEFLKAQRAEENSRPGEYFRIAKKKTKEIEARLGESAAKAGIDKVTIRIPGDGEFTIYNTTEVLRDVRKRVAKMGDVAARPPSKNARVGASEPFDIRSKAVATIPEGTRYSAKPIKEKTLAEAKADGTVTFTPKKKGTSTTLGFMGANPQVAKALGQNFAKAARTVSTATSQLVEGAKTPPPIRRGVKQLKEAMIEHHRQIRGAESTSQLLKKTVKDVVAKPDRQILMVHAFENKMRGEHWNKLTEIEKGVVRWAAKEKRKLNQFIDENRVLERMDEKQYNHIFHHWIDPKTGQPYSAMYGKFSKGLPQAKQRSIPTYEKGIEAGMKPATTNIGELIGLEWEAAMRAHQTRQLIQTVHNTGADPKTNIKLTPNGKPKPIRMAERWDLLQKQGLTDSYVRYSTPALDKAMMFRDANGQMVRLKGALGIRKEVYPFVRAYIETPNYGNLSKLNFAMKSAKLGLSMFHVVSLGMQELANRRIPFVNIPRGLKLKRQLGPTVRLLHQEGLELFKGYEDLGFQERFFPGRNIAEKFGNVVTFPMKAGRDFIFKIVQPGMKTSFAHHSFEAKLLPGALNRLNKKTGSNWTVESVMDAYEKGKPIPKEARKAAREAVEAADSHFSGEDYKRALLETNRFMAKAYFAPEARKAWQAGFLSPTWQREHLIVGKNVAKSFMPDKWIRKLHLREVSPEFKREYRRYAYTAIAVVGAVDLWNWSTTKQMDGKGRHLWENPEGKRFAVRAPWDEPSYTMTDKNGKERTIQGGPAYIRPLKSIFELAEGAADPIKKTSYKLSPWITALAAQLNGYKYKGWEDIPKRAWDFITDTSTPIVVSQTARVVKGEREPEAAIYPFFGMPTSVIRGKKTDTTKTRPTRDQRQPRPPRSIRP